MSKIFSSDNSETVVITFGTFDLFHAGHLNILEKAKKFGDKLIVGVSSDQFSFCKKNKYPVFNETDRMRIVGALDCVDEVFLEEYMELKKEYILEHNASILIMGDDWKGKFDYLNDVCTVFYVRRTPNISTTEIIEKILVEYKK